MNTAIEQGFIDIVTPDGIKTIPAEIFGNWAVHGSKFNWSVTHAGTGLKIAVVASKEGAIWLMNNLPPLPEKTSELGKWKMLIAEAVDYADEMGTPAQSDLARLIELGRSPELRRSLRELLCLMDDIAAGNNDDDD